MREWKRKSAKVVSLVLTFCMLVGMIPMSVFAATSTNVGTALTEAKAFIDGLTINNTNNDPSTVVSTWGSEFSWDNEKRETSNKNYLFEWSYYNGVVFEGLDDVYDVTKDSTYSDYVIKYLSSMITSDGGWTTCSNQSSRQCAGYNASHGADCYKTASLLIDYYKITNDGRYLTMAETLYNDLQKAQTSYASSDRGGNYNHTWSSTPTYAVWLDGLYMIQPFMAEYASYVNDADELDKIAARFAWIGDNMYDESVGLYYHAANSSSDYYNNNGKYWGRAIGWYAAALVDVMDYMTGDNLTAMQSQFKKLVDGMIPYQTSKGMWRQFVNVDSSIEETSVTALMAYAIQKAVNNGWLDSTYAQYAQDAFVGMCDYALDDSGLHYICFKGSTSDYSDPSYNSYVNEGKGVGPFIMAYAEILEANNKNDSGDSETEIPSEQTVTVDGTEIKVSNITGTLTGAQISDEDKTLVDAKGYAKYVAYDLNATLADGTKSTVSIPVPADWNATEDKLVGVSVENGELKEIKGTYKDGVYSFEVSHFSAKGVALMADAATAVKADGKLAGETTYTLVTNGKIEDGAEYLIVNTATNGTGYALRNQNTTTATSQAITISNGTATINSNESNCIWKFTKSENGYAISNGNRYIRLSNSRYISTTSSVTTVTSQGNSVFWLNNGSYYLRYSSEEFERSNSTSKTSRRNVYLFKKTVTKDATVTLMVDPGVVMLKPADSISLSSSVLVDEVDTSDFQIMWNTSDPDIVKVENGTVIAVADGTATITAVLESVNGRTPTDEMKVEIPVTVKSKSVVSGILTGNTSVTTRQNVEPDFSNIKLEVTYNDGTTGIITADNGLVIEGYDIASIGYSYAKISYNGKEYGTVRVTVEGNPYENTKGDATEYPEYPQDGAVRIDKTAKENAETFKNTGVTHVELDVAGISVKSAVDVVLVTDLSNSMAWTPGTRTDATAHENTKLNTLKQSVASFADVFLAADDEGNPTQNTVSLVTFGGYDADHTNKKYDIYADPTQTLLLGSDEANTVKNTVNNIMLLADDYLNQGTSTTGYYLSFDGGSTYGENYGNTNYDHAFMQTADAIKKLKAAYKEQTGTEYDESSRQIYVLFMTDGAPSNYNGVYYNYKTGDRADVNCTWVNESGVAKTYTMGNNGKQYSADEWYQYIAGGTYNSSTDTILGNPLYWADQVYNTVSVANIYNIGFDLDNGGFSSMTFTQSDGRPLSKVLEKLVSNETLEVFSANDETGLTQIYSDLATKIRYAGTSAQVTDIIDNDFTLQMSSTSGSGNNTAELGTNRTITVTTYDLWTKEETKDSALIGTRKGTSEVQETVTFNAEGTEAYSDKVENGTKNIMSTAEDGTVTIEAHYFTYTKLPEGTETFKWTIGNITDKEIVLGFDAYLKGSLEGECKEGIYYTNEKATVEYIDINGYHATQTFPVPAVSWGGATTTIRFYLVNEKGESVNHAGEVVPPANRVFVGDPVVVPLNLNSDVTIPAQEIKAASYVPDEYFLYDINASYEVQTASGSDNTISGGITKSEPSDDAKKTTQDNLGNSTTQTGAQTTVVIDAEETYYTWSTVGFGVRWDLSTTKVDKALELDQIVIDYGKAIQVDVLKNDIEEIASGYTGTLVGFATYNASTNLNNIQHSAGTATYTSSNGKYSIVDGKAQFQLTKMLSEIEKVFCVIKVTKESDEQNYYYLYEELDIIPATNVYYETAFANVFSLETTGTAWETAVDGTTSDNLQDDGTIGVNQTYGYDNSYTDDKYLSNASSLKVEGAGVKATTAKFSFTGTGFDLISRTGAQQGSIRVDIYKDEARTTANRVKSVTVSNKSESNLELYQIPVVSVNDLPYNTYYVTIGVSAAYDDPIYDALDRGGEFYFDAIRIYDPVKGNSEAETAYVADGESDPIITEVRAQLIAAEDYDITTSTEGMTFIDKTQEGADVATYKTIGPNNEVYLSKGQGIAFEISSTEIPASIDIGAKAPNSAKAQLTANISNTMDAAGTGIQKDISSATPQYFDLMEKAETDLAALFENGKAYVVITNTGDGVLSITDIKVAYGDALGIVSYSVSRSAVAYAYTVLNSENEVEANYDIQSAEFTSSTCKLFKTATMKVVTSTDVESLEVLTSRGTDAKPTITSEVNDAGEKVWTVSMTMYILGNKTYTITGYGADGTVGTSATASIRVNLF